MELVRNIPSCIDVSRARSTQFVDEKAIGLRDRWRDSRQVGIYPDAGDGEVAWHTNAVGGHDRLQPPVPFERSNLISGQQFDTVRAVDGADDCADLLAHNPGVREAVYVVLCVPAGRSDVPAVKTLLRPQVRLGERRPAIGDTWFSADDRDPAAVTLLPQGHSGVAPGEGAADDYDRILVGYLRHPAIFPRRRCERIC